MAIQEIRVCRTTRDVEGEGVRSEIKKSFGFDPGEVKTVRGYWLEGVGPEDADRLGKKLLVDPVIQKSASEIPTEGEVKSVKVAYKPGVMDPEANSIMEAARILGIEPQAVSTYWEYLFQKGTVDEIGQVTNKLLVNPTVQEIVKENPKTLIVSGEPAPVEAFDVSKFSDDEFSGLVVRKRWSLDEQQRNHIREYSEKTGKIFTDVELGTLDQTWSEHCGHPTFKAKLIVDGVEKKPLIERIKSVSFEFPEKIISAFKDNAGVIPFYDGIAICAKGETHNSPVALEPYGGAMTRTGGVIRDLAGLGEGGENSFSFDINCFAPPDMPKAQVPAGCHDPIYLLRNNFKGIRDYGNRMGIPTVSAAFFFHPDFAAKCTSLGVTFGIIPENRAQKKEPKAGQLIVSVGGRTGRDGILGASFSSREMTDQTIKVDGISVQIGNPIEEKRTFDALTEARDANLIDGITDCGGGGYSSAIDEIAAKVGAEVHLDRVRVKYAGLSSEEIWLSEAQERMILACEPENVPELEKIMKKHGVEMTIMGKFTGDKRLRLMDGERVVCDLDMEFLHNPPQRILEASWKGRGRAEDLELPADWVEAYKKVLGDWNNCSQESVVRQYDHGVQGITALAPFTGVHEDVLNDGYVCQPIRGKPYGLVAAYGFNPIFNRIDPYEGSIWSVAEALSKFTAVGGNYKEAALIDNFIWPKPTKEMLGSLDRSVDGLCDAMKTFEIPCVSGKDSLSSTYRNGKEVIEIPPVLNISVFGRIPDAEKTVSLDFKKTNSTICFIGNVEDAPAVDLKALPNLFDKVHGAIKSGKILSCHAVSRGGPAAALARMCFGGDCGAKMDFSNIGKDKLFKTTTGCFIAEFENPEEAEEALQDIPHVIIGKTQEKKEIEITQDSQALFSADIYELKSAWQEPMKGVL
ncbi:MAG: PurL [Candidatus Levybacteria bacterium]|nr:PurL [Candidatus Levybacteria bacterium]